MVVAEPSCLTPPTRSEIARSESTVAANPQTENFSVLPPKHSSPLHTNKASSPPSNHSPEVQTAGDAPPLILLPTEATAEPSLVEKIRRFEDKTLKRLAPVTISASGRPSVLIPDAVFQKGADLHKDFIVCCFNGRPPPYSQIQSVMNHMWGKGRKLEIHNNPAQRTVLVRIQSDYLKQKILEKGYWYVGDSMFYVVQWTSLHTAQSPTPKSIQLWAHLTGVPLDLRHQQGLSLVSGLVGEPKETDDFTKNLVSLTFPTTKTFVPKHPKIPTPNSSPSTSSLLTNSTPSISPQTFSVPSSSTFTPLPVATSVSLPPPVPEKAITLSTKFPHLPSPTTRPFNSSTPDFNSENSPPDPRLRQSLKRSRSDPTLSPPNSSFLPPFQFAKATNVNRPPIAPLLLTLPPLSDPNPYSLLATDSSLFQGKLPSLS
ncbi:hypothetical protein IGI04_003361 [Brassica rapa subsp. trilocularis]|uniref:DUF4283 domain-containing protein n=1 Tax=Brassica rapa subsp. trilocularis TaxID=1813537 RepID=A0ABQ7NY83_BRACM|nr:hypothetical protein IGI04_003361 [Brassica rapa subsp. trilocularis]